VPRLLQVVLDCTDARALAEFYRELLGYSYRAGDETPKPSGDDWLVLIDAETNSRLAFQEVSRLAASTWPKDEVPQQLHLDMMVSTSEDLDRQHERATSLKARMILDRSDDENEPLRVYADPAGHPFCMFVG
jgi:hypothetical protein